jgi:uncharacterized protein YggU (UPF0235/DUF167 family)
LADIFRETSDGIVLSVRLTPRAASDAVDGVKSDASGRAVLAARVRAVPEKGAANTALEQLIAKWLGVARSTVAVTGGATQRVKSVSVTGDKAELVRRVMQLVPEASKTA